MTLLDGYKIINEQSPWMNPYSTIVRAIETYKIKTTAKEITTVFDLKTKRYVDRKDFNERELSKMKRDLIKKYA